MAFKSLYTLVTTFLNQQKEADSLTLADCDGGAQGVGPTEQGLETTAFRDGSEVEDTLGWCSTWLIAGQEEIWSLPTHLLCGNLCSAPLIWGPGQATGNHALLQWRQTQASWMKISVLPSYLHSQLYWYFTNSNLTDIVLKFTHNTPQLLAS